MTYSDDLIHDPKFYRDVTSKRFMAWIVDTILVLVLAVIIVPFTAFTALFFFPILYATIDFAYRTISLANRSATLGMRLTAIEIRNDDGTPLDLGQALIHTVIFMCAAARGQSLTDIALGTAAMNRRSLR